MDYLVPNDGIGRLLNNENLRNCETGESSVFRASGYPISIAEMPTFVRVCDRLLTDDERNELFGYLAIHPEAGDVMPDTGGVRKLRWGIAGRGKRGGVRVIYYFRDLNMPLYMLAMYSKGEQINLSMAERKMVKRLVNELVAEHGHRLLRLVSQQLNGA